jgi:hypothetical protein
MEGVCEALANAEQKVTEQIAKFKPLPENPAS